MSHRPSPLLLTLLVLLGGSILSSSLHGQTSVSLDGAWLFKTDPKKSGKKEGWFKSGLSTEGWKELAVPGFWDGAGLERFDGLGWYRRGFSVKKNPARKYALVCDAVDDNATVWVNGTSVGTHEGYGRRFFFDVTQALKDGENILAFCVEDREGPGGLMGSVRIVDYSTEEDLLKSPEHAYTAPPLPDWAAGAVVYEVYPRSFSAQGGFRGLEERLSEIRDLGATIVWLMPIHPVGAKNRKGSLGSPYAVADYYAVNPEFGTLADFRSLVRTAHKLGLRILIDLVANHTAWDNPLITEHPDWFTRNDKGEIVSPNPDWHDVADLNYASPDLRSWMIRMMAYWIKEMDIDGFRCDVAEMVPLDFWKEAREFLDKGKPVLMLAEGTDPRLHLNGFDITYAWNTYDILGPLYAGKLGPAALAEELKREFLQFPLSATRLRFLSNHDKNVYDMPAVERYGVNGAKAAAVLMNTLPGLPLIYNGDEIGNTKRLDLFEKVPIDWRKDSAQFRAHYKVLNALRARFPSMRSGSISFITTGLPPGLCAYTRTEGTETTFIAINFTKKPVKAVLPIPAKEGFGFLYSEGKGEMTPAGLSLNLPGYGFWIGKR